MLNHLWEQQKSEGAQGHQQGRPKHNKPTKNCIRSPLDTDLGCRFPWNSDHLKNPIEFIELWEIVRDFPSKYLQRSYLVSIKTNQKKTQKYHHHRNCFKFSFEVDRYKPYSEARGRE